MQFIIMLIFLVVWLLILWTGSILLERTGLDRNKSRFQALSALTGTGFTTTEAEGIVNHPKRRKITTWLIFLGNTGILAFIILMILYVRTGLAAPTAAQIGLAAGVLVVIFLMLKLRVIDLITDGILGITGAKRKTVPPEGLLHRHGNYGVWRVMVETQDAGDGVTVGEALAREKGTRILAIERGDAVMPYPEGGEVLQGGDYLLCYGRVEEGGQQG